MPWMTYDKWAGNVIGSKLRVPATFGSGIACYGPALSPISLRAGATGTIVNVLPQGAGKPAYVKFSGQLDYSLAAEVSFEKALNNQPMWDDFHNSQMPANEATVVIVRRVLDGLDVEYR